MLRRNIGQDLCVLRLGLPLGFGLALLVGLLLTMGTARSSEVALAQGSTIRYVAPSPAGNDGGNDCSDSSAPCATVQHAVDVASPGDEIRVATGIYTDVHARPRNDIVATGVVTQVVYISKTVTLRGGYTTADWTTSDPEANPTTLDAQGRGRVLYITSVPSTGSGQAISPTIEGLCITGGDAAGLGGSPTPSAGGGVYVITATVIVSNNQVLSNTALVGGGLYFRNSDGTLLVDNLISGNDTAQYGNGGGLYFGNSAYVTLTGNTISHNEAGPLLNGFGAGGGVMFGISPGATLSGNIINDNRASWGGGLYFYESPTATLCANTVSNNVGNHSGWGMKGYGGVYFNKSNNATLEKNTISGNSAPNWCAGVCFVASDNAMLIDNAIVSNTKVQSFVGWGVGVYFHASKDASLVGNTISHNTGKNLSNLGTILGGGLYLNRSSAALISNTISSNGATQGGGLYADFSTVMLTSNTITGNVVYPFSGRSDFDPVGYGGGLYLNNCSAALTNTVIADNQVYTMGNGSGLYINGSSPRLLHTTIARNSGGDGSGVYITGTASSVALTNTILVSHTVGITVAAGNTATLEATLWGTDAWANLADWGGAGAIFTGTINLWDDPAFLDLDAGDYHITSVSAAINKGVDAGVTTDIDGDPRPAWCGYDLGADEFVPCVYLPVILRDGIP